LNWVRQGRVFDIPSTPDHTTHATAPTPWPLDQEKVRIYFSRRDRLQRSWPTYLETRIDDFRQVSYVCPTPIINTGRAGCFDDSGVMISSLAQSGGKIYLYYSGWNTGSPARYRIAIGLAISEDSGRTFTKWSEGPLLDRNEVDPISVSMPWVLQDQQQWRMWYMSFTQWVLLDGTFEPYYQIEYAESADGIHWKREGQVSLGLSPEEGGLARPTVIRENNIYRMWFCYRSASGYRTDRKRSYRIGYAESPDGLRWTRQDAHGLAPASEGWDSEMVAYPGVAVINGQKQLFYNGNGFGQSGFGWATCEKK
jgi:hypothetical protein